MASDAKRKRLDCEADTVDRISNLPRNLLDLSLERLPLHDAARTTILSKTWRNIWVTHPHLVFDRAFMSQLVSKKDEQAQLSEVSTTVSNILLLHSGPILKFHLFIPRDLPLHQTLAMDCWIKNISNNGVRIMEILNNPVIAYKMPSYLFSCLELTHLSLTNCILNPPVKFGGFRNLIGVGLVKVIITGDMSFGSQLETLNLKQCTGIKHLGCQFKCNTNLSKLMIIDSGEIDWRWFECTKRVQNLCLVLNGTASSSKNSIKLDKLLANMPRIYWLHLDGFFLKFLEPDPAILKGPITTMENVNTLHLTRVDFRNKVQIQYVLYLIRNLPNLRKLHITQERAVKITGERMKGRELLVLWSIQRYLESPNFVGMILDKLETVEMKEVVGSWVELRLIRHLLASSPSLRWMKLSNSTTINDPKEELKILQDVIRFPRVSPAAEIICT